MSRLSMLVQNRFGLALAMNHLHELEYLPDHAPGSLALFHVLYDHLL